MSISPIRQSSFANRKSSFVLRKCSIVLRQSSFVFVLALLLLACDKSSLGFDQLDRDLQDPQFPASPLVASGCYGKFNNNGPSDNLVLGKDLHYESRALLRFALEHSAMDSVSSVRLVLHTKKPHAVPFRIYPATIEWDELNASWHDAQSGQPWFNEGGDYDTSNLIAAGTLASDTVTLIELDTTRLRMMLNHEYGLVVIPEPGLPDSANFISLYSRTTSGKKPEIKVFYGTKEKDFEATESAYIVDTLALRLQTGDLWVGSGYVFRSYLKFNLDSLSSTGTVVTAELKVRPDTAEAMRDTIELGVHRLTKDYETSQDNATFDAATAAARNYVIGTDSVVALDIRRLVQFWAQKPDSNFGLLLTLEPQNFDVSRLELKTGSAGPTLRIGYVNPPHSKY